MFRILLLSFCCCAVVHAGGFDSSGRPFDIIFGDDSSLEMSVSYLKPSVNLNVSRNIGEGLGMPSKHVDTMVGEYTEPFLALRLNFTKRVNCAAQWERPFRFKTSYPDDALSYQSDSTLLQSQVAAPLDSEYTSESLSFACRYAFSFDHQSSLFKQSKVSVIAGPKLQRIDGSFSSDLTNQNLGKSDNYVATLDGSTQWGYLFGLAYEIPDIAFRASLFFHNEIHHELNGQASAPLSDFSGVMTQEASGETLTPRALNLRIQSGIAEDWLAFLELRWGDWSRLNVLNVEAGALSQELKLFTHDTLNYKFGFGVRLNPRISLGGYIESFINLNEPTLAPGVDGTNLRNPQAERYSLAFGGKYHLTKQLGFGLGGSYYYVAHGRFQDNSYTVDLERSHALAFSGTLAFSF